jgi:hypothetical protein
LSQSNVPSWPTALITMSTGIVNVEPSIATGLARPSTPGSPSFMRMHSRPGHLAVLSEDAHGRGQPAEDHAVHLREVVLERVGRHLGERAAVDDRDLLGARGASRRSAASIAVLPAPITATRRPIGIESSGSTLVRSMNWSASSTCGRSSPSMPELGHLAEPGADEHGVEVREQLVDRHVLADARAEHELDARALGERRLGERDRDRLAEGDDAEGVEAAGLGLGLVAGHVVAELAQRDRAGRGRPGRCRRRRPSCRSARRR